MSPKRQKAVSVDRQNTMPPGVSTKLRIALSHHREGRLEEAAVIYESVLLQMPDHAETLVGFGAAMLGLGRNKDAIIPLERALVVRPDDPNACFSLAEAYRGVGKIEEAYAVAIKGIEGNPDYKQGYLAVADALLDMGRYEEARSTLEKLSTRNPDDPEIVGKIGAFHYQVGELAAAEEKLVKAAQYLSDNAEVQWHLAALYLSQRRWAEGWALYHWRWPMSKRDPPEKLLDFPIWNGESLVGKKIVVWGEQGLGDELMFATCIPDLIDRACPDLCVLACDPRLASVLARNLPKVTILPMERRASEGRTFQLPLCDVQIAAGDIPKFLRTRDMDYLAPNSWISADPEGAAKWRERLDALGTGLKIGVAWRGGMLERFRRQKSSKLAQWKEILQVPGVTFINLQYGDCRDDLEFLRADGIIIHDFEDLDPVVSPDQQIALISELDLVIQTSNASAHMAGSLGIPVWNMLPYAADWRWGIEAEECLWYPSMRLFRQSSHGDWESVMGHVAEELHKLVLETN